MNWSHPYWIPSLVACLLCLVVAASLWRRRSGQGAIALMVFTLAIALWALGHAFQLAAIEVSNKIFWRNFQFFGIGPLPLLLLSFALTYSGRAAWLTKPVVIFLGLMPTLTLVSIWTNDSHQLIWTKSWLDSSGPIPMLASEFGILCWAWIVFAQTMLIVATVLLVQASLKSYRHYRLQLSTFLIGLAIPWLATLVYITGVSPWPYLDLTPYSFTLASALIAWSVFRHRLVRNIPLSYETVLQALGDPLFVIDQNQTVMAVNSAASRLLELPENLIIGRTTTDLLEGNLILDSPDNELVLTTKTGEKKFFDIQATLLKGNGSREMGRLVVLRDISDRKKMEDVVRSSQEKLVMAFKGSPDGVVITRLSDGLIVEVNQTFHEKMFYTRNELVGETTTSINIWANPDDRDDFVTGLSTPPHHITMETEFRAKNGTIIPSYVSARLMEMDGEMHIITVAVDITEQKKIEAEQQARIHRVHGQQAAVIAMATDPALEVGELDGATKMLTRQTAQALEADQAAIWLVKDQNDDQSAGRLECACIYLAAEGVWVDADPVDTAECPEYLEAIGSVRALPISHISTDPCLAERASVRLCGEAAVSRLDAPVLVSGRLAGIITAAAEVTERTWFDDESVFAGQAADQVAQALANHQRTGAEEALRFSEERYRFLIDHLPYGLFVVALPKGNFVFTNSVAGNWLGHNLGQVDSLDIWQVIESQDHPALSRRLTTLLEDKEAQPDTRTYSIRRADGRSVRLDVALTPVDWEDSRAVMGFARDVTVEEQLERQLHQSQKMEAVGTLASGVAHDFNNLLQVISGYIQLLDLNKSLNESGRYQVEKIHVATGRAAELIGRLSTFARKAETQKKPLDFSELINRVVDMLSRTIPRMITIKTELAPGPMQINGDTTTLEQVLMNLGTNARDAMPEGGQITIIARSLEIPERDETREGGLEPGRWLEVKFKDTGLGMEPQTATRIFEPFFTTKSRGKGTGLGLSTAYGIVESHEGKIACSTQPGQGTTFTIHLPLIEDGVQAEPIRSAKKAAQAGEGETILVVDDEEPIRNVAVEALELNGYRALTAATGEEALNLYRAHGQGIDLVVLDLGMPGMGGAACLKEMSRLNPDIKILIASGYRAEELSDHLEDAAAWPFLAKPYRLSKLVEVVGEILNR